MSDRFQNHGKRKNFAMFTLFWFCPFENGQKMIKTAKFEEEFDNYITNKNQIRI